MSNTIRLLHAEDDTALAEMVSDTLIRKDDRFEIETVTTAEKGLESLSESAFDCIVSDYDMPGQDGIEFLHSVREGYPTLPFILFTGKGSEDIASEAISAGVTDYLQKGRGTEQYDLLANRITNAVSRHRAQRNYQELFEKADVGLAINDIETGEIIDANQAYAEITGRDRIDVLDKNPAELLPDNSHYTETDAIQLITQAVETGSYSFEWPYETADGDQRWGNVTLTSTVLHGQQRVLASVEDITEHKTCKQELQRKEGLFRKTRNIADIGIWEYDTTADELTWCDNVYDIHDVPRDAELTLERVVDCYHPDDQQPVRDTLVEAAETGEPYEFEARVLTEAGDERWVQVRGRPQYEAGSVVRVRGTVQDITDRKKRERRLQRQNERLDKFTSIVSHELQNPLHKASSQLELTADECDTNHQDVMNTHKQMEQIIEDLLTFARVGNEAIEYSEIDLRQLSVDCWESVQSSDASLVIETEQAVQADCGYLKHMLRNLFENAVEHARADVSVSLGDIDGGFYIEDDGPGIPKADREAVFEAGYSTAFEGTGFGLSIVEEVADAHDWNLEIIEGGDGGARFEITNVESDPPSQSDQSEIPVELGE